MSHSLNFFDQLQEGELDVLLEYCNLSEVKKGGSILKQGELDTREVYLLIVGKVCVETERNGQTFPLAELNAGEIFGEFSLFSNERRSATVHALETSEILHIDMDQIDQMFGKHPEIAYTLVKHIANKACHKLNRITEEFSALQDQVGVPS